MSFSLVFTVSPIIRALDVRNLGRAILWVIRIHALIIVAMATSNLALGTQLYRFANLGNYTPETFIAWGRVSGLFAEPAYFGWFVALGLFTLLNISIRYKIHTISILDYLLLVLALLFSTSLAGVTVGLIALFGTVWVRMFYLTPNIGQKLLATSTLTIGLIIVLVLFSSNPTQTAYLFDRLSNITTDASFQDRIPGSLEASRYIFLQNPLTGTGLGNLAQSVKDGMPFFIYKWPENIDIHISWAAVFATTGLFGGVIYALMLFGTVIDQNSRPLGWGLILVSFVYGGFALGVLWWFLALTLVFQKPQLIWRSS
ncbi:MAG: hypothetical protein SFU83_14745 [Meiothermus sp.]|nr:hypothetical protein [Meiothermus sp.]